MRRRRSPPSPRSIALVEEQAGVGNVWSLETLRRWLAEKAGSNDVATLKEYVDMHARASGAPLHFGRPDCGRGLRPRSRRDASQILPVVEKLDHAMDAVQDSASRL